MKIGIIGYGEIGNSLHKIYHKYNVKIIDPGLNYNEDLSNSDVLNICIPYINNFVEIVNEYIDKLNPNLTVIHSTVAPGTTKQIKGNVCHSPIRGLHPNLDIGIKTFLKYIGSENNDVAKLYQQHLTTLGINSYICKNSITTEYAKLLDTTYYGLCIAFHADVLSLCKDNNLDFEEIMTIYNNSYNEGYSKLNKQHFCRPVLYGSNKIGGHCVVPNALILEKYLNSQLIQGILKYQ